MVRSVEIVLKFGQSLLYVCILQIVTLQQYFLNPIVCDKLSLEVSLLKSIFKVFYVGRCQTSFKTLGISAQIMCEATGPGGSCNKLLRYC